MGKNAAAVSLGRRGGKARAANMTKEERSQAASEAAKARWKDHRKKSPPTEK